MTTLAQALKPSVLADQGPDGSPFLVLEGEPSSGARIETTEGRGWTDRTVTIDKVTFDKFEVLASRIGRSPPGHGL